MENILTKLAFKINPTEIGYDPGITTGEEAIANILILVYFWAGIVAVLVIIIAGIFFVTSRGDANQMKRSKDAIRGAVIGLIVVMVAFAITRFIIGGVSG
jgi:heme/copper-type cytochrome/quinol oxidase subunit 2